MMRLAAMVLLAVLAALPLAVRPSSPPVTWLATAALVVGGVGVITWSVPLVTAAGSLVLHLVKTQRLSDQEVLELQKLIEQLDSRGKRPKP